MGQSQSVPEADEREWARSLKLEWTKQKTANLVSEMRRKTKDVKVKVLVFGPTGAGKSALCNGFKTILDDSSLVSTYFPCGAGAGTFSKKFKPLISENVTLIDMNGLMDTNRITDENIEDIISGKIKFYAKLTDWLEVEDTDDASFLQNTSTQDGVSCVVLVLPISGEISDELRRMIECAKRLNGKGVTSLRVVLTHLDVYDQTFKRPVKLPGLFDAPTVQTAVKARCKEIGLPPRLISVARNYHDQETADDYTNHLLAFIFLQIVTTAEEYCQGVGDEERIRNQ